MGRVNQSITQHEQVIQFIEEHGSITPMDAINFRPHGCIRLAARIHELKKLGYDFDTVIETKKFEDGGIVQYARYFFKGTKPEVS